MFIMLGTMLVTDVIVLLAWHISDRLERSNETFQAEKSQDKDLDIEVELQLEHCVSVNNNIWLGMFILFELQLN